MNKTKDYARQRFGKLVAVCFDHIELRDGKSHGGRAYWKFKCDCGNEVIRIPSNIRSNKHNACRECLTGDNTWSWKGTGQIPYDAFNAIRHGAEARQLELLVTIDYLWELFQQQDGKCSLTGWPISFNKTYRTKTSKTASLDRIDSTKGYIKGNLQWVHRDVNKLKKNLDDSKFIELCHAVARHTQTRPLEAEK